LTKEHNDMPAILSPFPPAGEQRSEAEPAEPERASATSRQEALLDEAIEETFPASDPISPMLVS
jgi:UDP-N-acetylglucosamine:LPS N-acetylglucosamine transferase